MSARLSSPEKVITTRGNPKAYLLEKILAKQADATVVDYPSAIKLVEDFERPSGSSEFIVAPIHSEDVTPLGDVPERSVSFVDYYGIPVEASQQKLLNLVNQALHQLRFVDTEHYQGIFLKHQDFDPEAYPEAPFEIEWDAESP